jgi:hypothetical protein
VKALLKANYNAFTARSGFLSGLQQSTLVCPSAGQIGDLIVVWIDQRLHKIKIFRKLVEYTQNDPQSSIQPPVNLAGRIHIVFSHSNG